MALQKDKVLDNGFTANYWKISEINTNHLSGYVTIRVVIYKDAAARQGNSSIAFERE